MAIKFSLINVPGSDNLFDERTRTSGRMNHPLIRIYGNQDYNLRRTDFEGVSELENWVRTLLKEEEACNFLNHGLPNILIEINLFSMPLY
jgi:hypothetical protein